MRRLPLSALALAPFLVLLGTPSVRAATFDFVKLISFEVTDYKANPNVVRAGNGEWRYAWHTFAGDKHLIEHEDSSTEPAGERCAGSANTPFQAAKNKQSPSSHLVKFTAGSWDQTAGFGGVPGPGDTGAVVSSVHPDGDVTIALDAGVPMASGTSPNEKFHVEGTVDTDGRGTSAVIPPSDWPESSYADACSFGQFKLKGKFSSTDIVGGKSQIKWTSINFLKGAIFTNALPDESKATVKDPLVMVIRDEVTNAVVAQQTLFRVDWDAEAGGSVSWDDTGGLVIASDASSSAGVAVTSGSWVDNPFNGEARVDNGTLTLSGDFAGLGWSQMTTGGVTTATLPVSELSPSFSLEITPDGLGSPTNDLDVEFEADVEGQALERTTGGVSMPALPGALYPVALLGLAATGGVLLRRRHLGSV